MSDKAYKRIGWCASLLMAVIVAVFVLAGCDSASSGQNSTTDAMTMPNVIGHTVQETEKLFEDKGFTNLKFENVNNDIDREICLITEQNVKEGEQITSNSELIFQTINDRDLAYFRGKIKDLDSYVDDYIEYRNGKEIKDNVLQSKERRILRTVTGMKSFYEQQTNPDFKEYYAKDLDSILRKLSDYFKLPTEWNPYKPY